MQITHQPTLQINKTPDCLLSQLHCLYHDWQQKTSVAGVFISKVEDEHYVRTIAFASDIACDRMDFLHVKASQWLSELKQSSDGVLLIKNFRGAAFSKDLIAEPSSDHCWLVMVRLTVGEATCGVLSIMIDAEVDEYEVERLLSATHSLAGQWAQLLSQDSLYDLSLNQREKIKSPSDFYQEVTDRLGRHSRIEQGIRDCHQYLSRYIPTNRLTLLLYEQPNQAFRLVADSRGFQGQRRNKIIPITDRLLQFLQGHSKTHATLINEPEKHQVSMEYTHVFGLDCSSIDLFLYQGGQLFGQVVIGISQRSAFDEDHKALLKSLEVPFYMALKNLQLDLMVEHKAPATLVSPPTKTSPTESSAMGVALQKINRITHTNTPVLLLGETGVGKDYHAQQIHEQSDRNDRPFLNINCGAIPEQLIESELFGHEKGAFTGATQAKQGYFEAADGGTVFLDEIGELPLLLQSRLLHVLQNKEIIRVGSTTAREVDVRIIAATNRDLTSMVAERTFRQDLFYRLNVFPIVIPPLRERQGDIIDLAEQICGYKARELNLNSAPRISSLGKERLLSYDWPGNIRELENLVERALLLCDGCELDFLGVEGANKNTEVDCISARVDQNSFDLKPLDEIVKRHIEVTLSHTKGQVAGGRGAARILDIDPGTLRSKMRKLGIKFGRSWGG